MMVTKAEEYSVHQNHSHVKLRIYHTKHICILIISIHSTILCAFYTSTPDIIMVTIFTILITVTQSSH